MKLQATQSTLKACLTGRNGLRWSVAGALTAAVAVLLTTTSSGAPGTGIGRLEGARTTLGMGEVTSFAELDAAGAPRSIGIAISGAALASLPIEATPAVDVAGYYPTKRCVRYDAASDAYVISLEGFAHRVPG